MLEEDYLLKRFSIRWSNLEQKSINKKLTLPNKNLLWNKVLTNYKNGFSCEYCYQKMMISDPIPPHHKSFSIEHKTSLDSGGNNDIENIAIVCTRCNIIKGTMSEETFRKFIEPLLLNPELLDKVFKEMWNGRFANKLERNNKQISFVDSYTRKRITFNLPSDSTLPGCVGSFGVPLEPNNCKNCRDNEFCREIPTHLAKFDIEVWNLGQGHPYFFLLSKDWPKCLGFANGNQRQGPYCDLSHRKCPHIELCGYVYRT
jgi:5-methylcytosine-specific restriction endonuclease McrA